MHHWIDTSSHSDNVYVTTGNTLYIASVDKEHHTHIDEQLKEKKPPVEVLGSDSVKTIPYIQILSIVSKSTDKDVEIKYKAKKGPETQTFHFESLEKKELFVKVLGVLAPDTLQKSVYQQNFFTAALMPLYSLAACAFVVYCYFNKFRMAVLIIGGLWAAASLGFMVYRMLNPPEVTRWNIKGNHIRKTWYGLQAAGSLAMLMAAVAGFAYFKLPDNWGEKALSDQMAFDTLQPEDIPGLIERGADINYRDSYGETVLHDAVVWEMPELAIALIDAGADLDMKYEGVSILDMAIDYESKDVALAIIKAGTDVNGEYDGETYLERAINHNDSEVALALLNAGAELKGGLYDAQLLQSATYLNTGTVVIEALLRKGAATDAKIDGYTPMEFAEALDRPDVIAVFKKYAPTAQSNID